MIRNPEETKAKILKKSGTLFNTQGYKTTSISDITKATGYTKGAIYRHFHNKAELEKETLLHLSGIMFEKLRDRIRQQRTAGNKLRAVFDYFESYITDTPIKGGCPLLNAAVESDDAHPVLRKTALKILDVLRDSVVRILENGIRYRQIVKQTDKEHFATLMIAALEGAIMMSKLRGNNDDICRVTRHLRTELKRIEC